MAALSAFTAWIGVPYVGPVVAPTQAIAAAAAAGVFMTAIGSALHGQAHDGIDSVPETGTWLLQKGERVTTAKTSAKLDATLDRVANQSTGGGAIYSPTINIPINGNPDVHYLCQGYDNITATTENGDTVTFSACAIDIALADADFALLVQLMRASAAKKGIVV
ncbi:DUF1833 family protein [Klebsiella variicola]|uniref:DUF1833 family protein n=1 Tax=Klebsiella variicola TaxID=244366 RepID=UPI003877F0F9